MAMVYKAKDQILNRFVAVKILRDEFTTDEEFIKRFSIEAQSAASITHPNIVSVFDVGNEGNLYYIVMELIKGKTLKEIIIEEGSALPWKWSTNIAIQIASALEMAHKNNIVHRDIKPHNIIITEDGIAKVTDFGIAKAVSNSTITAFGSTIGSVHYFSPEHARGGFTDSKSDLYSLGVVMYEMLTGRVPFDADTPVSVALKHMQEEPVAPIEINPKIPSSINDIILKAMRKDTTLRYQSATEMLRDLNRALKDPDGNFVDNTKYVDDGATRKIPTLNNEEIRIERETKKKKENFFQKHQKLSIFLAVVALFIISIVGTIIYGNATRVKDVDVPNIVGIERSEAEKLITDAKLTVGEVKEEYNSEYAAGYVISQDPAYKETYNSVKEKSAVNFVVSLGIEEAVVPKVVGMAEEEAIKALEEAKLKYEVKEETSKKVEAGYVIEQETEADKTVNAGDTVIIHISTGVKKITVPSVLGKSETDATKELKDAGFKVVTKTTEDTSKDNDTVLEQSIDAGTEVEDGTSITITVNKIVETKTANLTINVKSLLGGKVVYEETTTGEGENAVTTKVAKNVELKVTVNDEECFKEEVDPTMTNQAVSITDRGTVQVKVFIDGIRYNTTQINLSETNKLTIDKRN